MSNASSHPYNLIGGHPALDFCNTIGYRLSLPKNEHLRSYGDLLRWGERAGVLPAGVADDLRRRAAASPGGAEAVLARALALREVLFRLFDAVAHGRTLPPGDLEALERARRRAEGHRRLVPMPKMGAYWAWDPGDDPLERVLWPVALSASELLTSGELSRVKQCAGEHCDWLFVDASKNRRRRWCDMKECGNRAKARRFARRRRAAAALRDAE